MNRRETYLSVCAIYRNEAPYLREWIEFHRLVGAERFILYNNMSTDDHRDVLAPLVAEGRVTVRDWPDVPGQMTAFTHCLSHDEDESRWIAFLDVDEFLFSPTGRPVPEVLREYEQWPAVGVCRMTFGTSGHPRPPEGLVIENYLRRIANSAFSLNRGVKCVVDPKRAVEAETAHIFKLSEGVAVDENGHPLMGAIPSSSPTHAKLRINHYWTRSEEEFVDKFDHRTRVDTGRRYPRNYMSKTGFSLEDLNELQDEAILSYAPALRAALERSSSTSPP